MNRIYVLIFAAIIGSHTLSADVPPLINYQGRITETDGNPETLTITFRLHTASTGGEALWEESQPVSATAGVFNVLLGSLEPFPAGVFRRDSLFLSLATETGELLPRQRVVSVAYAMRSGEADNIAATTITPSSIELVGGGGTWDATGTLTTLLLTVDSLSVGDTAVLDSEGRWVGPGQPAQSAQLDTTIFYDLEGDVVFFGPEFESVGFDQFIDVEGLVDLEFQLYFQLVTNFPFEVRLGYKQVTPVNVDLGPIGSIAAGLPSTGIIGTTVQTYGLLRDVETGNYRFWIEARGGSNITSATVIRGQIVVKVYR